MGDRIHLTYDGPVATITNDNPAAHNAFDDAMDLELFEAFAELRSRPDVRAIIWRGEGKSFSSGRDVSSIGNLKVELTLHELMRRGHRGIQQIWEIDAPIIVAHKGWTMGGSFQRALLCDIRVAAEGARFRLPELTYGVIPDTGGFGTLFQIAGHGLVSDMVLTGRVLSADEALVGLRDQLTECIGCGCLSLRGCALYNPDDRASRLGSGPRFLLGDLPVDSPPDD